MKAGKAASRYHQFSQEGGVQIARRTVAKYRDQLGVLSARMRKRV